MAIAIILVIAAASYAIARPLQTQQPKSDRVAVDVLEALKRRTAGYRSK